MEKFRTSLIPIVLALFMLLGAACGSDDGDDAGSGAQDAGQEASEEESEDESEEESEDESEEESTPEETGPPTIVATEFGYDAPDSLPAGETTFQFENVGEQKHIAVFVELLDGKTVDDVNTFIAEEGISGRPPSWAKNVPKANGFAKPGATTEFTADFKPGTYAMLCFVRDKETKKSHAELGMTAGITFE